MKNLKYILIFSILLINYTGYALEKQVKESLSIKVDTTKPALSKKVSSPSKTRKHIIKGDSLICGRIYQIWTFKDGTFMGEVIKKDSIRVTFRDNEYEFKKMKYNKIYSATDITVDSESYSKSHHKCMLYLDDGKVLDNIRPRMIIGDSLIYRDTAFRMLSVDIHKIKKVMFYKSYNITGKDVFQLLFLWPLIPYAIYHYSKYDDPEFDLSYMDLKWKKTMFGLFINSKYIRSLY